MNSSKLTVGIDIGGTNTVIGFVDDGGRCLDKTVLSTQSFQDVENFIKGCTDTIQSMEEKLPKASMLIGIGIAAPNVNYYENTIDMPANLKWDKVNLVDMIRTVYDCPVAIMNDADAVALGEMNYGAARGMENFIVITLGTGVGSGIVVNGQIVHGAHGLAGEYGHTIVVPNGRQCGCGRLGCLEAYASANGLRRTVFELISSHQFKSMLSQFSFHDLSGELITDAAVHQDPLALHAFDFTGRILGQALANLSAIFDPESIILFGGLMQAGDLLFGPTSAFYEQNLLNIYTGKMKLLKSNGNDGLMSILGACELVRRKIREKEAA